MDENQLKDLKKKLKEKFEAVSDKEEALDLYNDLKDETEDDENLSTLDKIKSKDALWDEYQKVIKKKFSDSLKLNDSIGKKIKIGDTVGILVDYSDKNVILQTEQGIIIKSIR